MIDNLSKTLIENLKSEIKWLRESAAKALGEIKANEAVELLIKCLSDKSWEVRVEAAIALGRIGNPKAVQPLIKKLDDKSFKVRLAVVEALGRLRDQEAVEPLARILKDKSVKIRSTAVWALWAIEGNLAIEYLIKALNDKNENVRSAAIYYLKFLKDKRAVQPLISMIAKSNKNIRSQIAETLGEIGDVQAVEPLIELLEDRDYFVRAKAAEALGKIKDIRAIQPLLKTLKDRYFNVVKEAAKALEKLGWQPKDDEIGAYYWLGQKDFTKLIEIGTPAVKALLYSLKRRITFPFDDMYPTEALAKIKDPRAVKPLIKLLTKDRWDRWRIAAANALGKIGDQKAVDSLIMALEDQSTFVQEEAIIALGKLGHPKAVKPITEKLKDERDTIRQKATWTLGKIGDSRAIKPLIKKLDDESKEVRLNAARALDALGWRPSNKQTKVKYWIAKQEWEKCLSLKEVAEPILLEKLKDPDLAIRISAINILGKLKSTQAIIPLINFFEGGDEEKAAIEALSRIGKPAIEPLIEVLQDRDLYVHFVAARTIGKIKDPRAVDSLIPVLYEPLWDVRQAAVQALGKIGDVKAISPLLKKLRDREWKVRKSALSALNKIEKKTLISLQNAYPDLVCSNCLTRAKKKKIHSKLFKPMQVVFCRNCKMSSYLIPEAKRIIGLIGGNKKESYFLNNSFFCPLWNDEIKRAYNADIDELQIIGGSNINYELAIQMVINELQNDAYHSRRGFKRITVKLINNPPLTKNTIQMLKNIFKF